MLTAADFDIIDRLVNGGAITMLVALVIYVLRQSESREKTMRESFADREKLFVETVKNQSNEFSQILVQQTSQFTRALSDGLASNTAALTKLEQSIDDRLGEMRDAQLERARR